MAHLVDYEEATTEKDKAFAALECSERKSAKARAWGWAEAAIEHAVSATLCSQAEADKAEAEEARKQAVKNAEKARQEALEAAKQAEKDKKAAAKQAAQAGKEEGAEKGKTGKEGEKADEKVVDAEFKEKEKK